MSTPAGAAPNIMTHFGLCVRDLEVSERFYTEALGFTRTHGQHAGNDFAQLLGLPTLDIDLVMVTLGHQRIELICHRNPIAGDSPGKPVNTIGFTHMAFNVPDVDAAIERIKRFGGSFDPKQRAELTINGEDRVYAFLRDPDGNRIELIKGSVIG